jgi:hypothetical protein
MLIQPNSIVRLLNNVPIDNKYRNTIYFGSKSAQTAYFATKAKYSYPELTYVKEQRVIRVTRKADDLFDCNYVMYQNSSYGTKWFYAFITKVEYINDNTSHIHFQIDVMQTWLVGYDYEIRASFVEREHVTDDEIGHNLIDEGLETGEYIVKNKIGTTDKDTGKNITDMAYLLGISDLSPIGSTDTIGGLYGNLYSGLYYWYFNQNSWSDMRDFIKTFIDAGKSGAITFIASIPAFLVGDTSGGIPNGESLQSLVVGFNKPLSDIDGYTPKNNKMFTYPYNLLTVSNNQGQSAEFRYEDFKEADGQPGVMFGIIGNISPSPVLLCSPIGYKAGDGGYGLMNTEYGIAMKGYPLCSWNDDIFKAWLVNNGVSTAVGVAGSIGAVVAGAVTGNMTVAGGGAMGIFNQMQQLYKASLQPDQAKGNINNGSLNIATDRQQFYFSQMQIKAEYARKIDDYFSMYGYKVNAVKVPNLNSRPHWNYVKTIDINITGSVPADDIPIIEDIYNKGITFWANGSEVGNYYLNNNL